MADPTKEQFDAAAKKVMETAPAGLSREDFFGLVDKELGKSPLQRANETTLKEPTTYDAGFDKSLATTVRGAGKGFIEGLNPMNTLRGFRDAAKNYGANADTFLAGNRKAPLSPDGVSALSDPETGGKAIGGLTQSLLLSAGSRLPLRSIASGTLDTVGKAMDSDTAGMIEPRLPPAGRKMQGLAKIIGKTPGTGSPPSEVTSLAENTGVPGRGNMRVPRALGFENIPPSPETPEGVVPLATDIRGVVSGSPTHRALGYSPDFSESNPVRSLADLTGREGETSAPSSKALGFQSVPPATRTGPTSVVPLAQDLGTGARVLQGPEQFREPYTVPGVAKPTPRVEVGTIVGKTPTLEDALTKVIDEIRTDGEKPSMVSSHTPADPVGATLKQSGKFGKSGSKGQAGGYTSGLPPSADAVDLGSRGEGDSPLGSGDSPPDLGQDAGPPSAAETTPGKPRMTQSEVLQNLRRAVGSRDAAKMFFGKGSKGNIDLVKAYAPGESQLPLEAEQRIMDELMRRMSGGEE